MATNENNEQALNMNEAAMQETDDKKGPTIEMQGVSGKKITADVKMVKVKKKARAVQTDKESEKDKQISSVEKEQTKEKSLNEYKSDNKSSDKSRDDASSGLEKVVETVVEAVKPLATEKGRKKVVEKAVATAKSVTKEAKSVVEKVSNEALKAGGELVNKVVDTVETIKNTTESTLVDTVSSVSDEKKEKSNKTVDQDQLKKNTARSSSQTKDTAKAQTGEHRKPASNSGHSASAGTTPDKAATAVTPKTATPTPTANTPSSVASTSSSQASKGVVDPSKSSLAATVARFAAQAEARKKAAEEKVRESSQRHGRPQRDGQQSGGGRGYGDRQQSKTYQGRKNGQGGSRDSGSSGGRQGYQNGGFNRFGGDKDKDADVKLQSHSRKPQQKKQIPGFDSELVNTTKEQVRSNFASKKGPSDTRNRRTDDERKSKSVLAKNRARGIDMGDDEVVRGRRKSARKKDTQQAAPVIHAVLTNVSLPDTLTVKEFAEAIKKTSAEVIKVLMGMGVMATLNQEIDYDTASIIADEFGIKTDKIVEVTEEDILFDDSEDKDEDLVARPPVVCVMGHVDHGKTSLLDKIRQSSVAAGEAGGITQHIGAYMVNLNGRAITFLDTPGHEAFTTMRARGAQATDIAILVVAADDGVMPQTIEAINHAKAAGTQLIVAINKIDRPGANPQRVKEELAKYDVISEDWGGSTVMVPVSAKTGEGVQELLEMVLLTADLMELKANPSRQAKGIVIEAKLDKLRGAVATLLVQRGTLHSGDTVVMGEIVGRIRAMADAQGRQLKEAGPSVPVEIIGLPEVPEAGDTFYQVSDEKVARQLAEKRRIKKREDSIRGSSRMSLDTLFAQMAKGEVKDLNLIVKADVQGSVEAVNQAFSKLSNDEVRINIVHSAVGAITETDIRLAEVSNAIVIGFNVRPASNVSDQAKASGVDLRLYRVIYHAIDDIEAAMKGLLAPKLEEEELGQVEIRQVFRASNIGTIGGGYVTQGKIIRNCSVRLVRDGIQIWDGKLASLKRFKDDVKEVAQGYECGISLENYNDIKEGDVIEAYTMKEVERD